MKRFASNVTRCWIRKKGTFIQGRNVHEYEEINDVVPNTHGIYLRVRAVFSTLSYVTVQDSTWFSYGDCENFCDLIIDLLNRAYSGNGHSQVHPPLSFFRHAYLSTMSDFCQDMRTVDTKLCDLVARKSSWQHYWTGYIPDSSSVLSSSGNSAVDSISLGVGRPDNVDVDRQLQQAMSAARQSQSEYDRKRNELTAAAQEEADEGGGGKFAGKRKVARKRGAPSAGALAKKVIRGS